MAPINVEVFRTMDKPIGRISFQNYSLAYVLEYVRDCINAYNTNLASYKGTLPNEVFAHRFFEKQAVQLDYTKVFYPIMQNSYDYVTRTYPDYDWPGKIRQIRDGSEIALIKNDMMLNNLYDKGGINRRITLYLDLRRIVMADVLESYTKEEYMTMLAAEGKLYNINFRAVKDIAALKCFHLNALEDIADFIKENQGGILEENTGEIWIPV